MCELCARTPPSACWSSRKHSKSWAALRLADEVMCVRLCGHALLHTHAQVLEHGWPLERALRLGTRNPATVAQLPGKGVLAVGADADVLLLDETSLNVTTVVASGVVARTPECVFKAYFE